MRRQELIILIGVIIFVFVMFIIYVFISLFSPSQTSPDPSPQTARPTESVRPLPISSKKPLPPSPPPLPSSLPESTTKLTKQELINLLPIQTEFANIEYLSVSDSFAITIKEDPYQENKTKIEQWFRTQGFNPLELNIYWQAYPEVTTE